MLSPADPLPGVESRTAERSSPRPRLAGVTDARADLLDQILSKAVVRERVTLSSGRDADYYVEYLRKSGAV